MSLKLVPFNANWVTHNKLDLHAIYRRPRFVEDKYGELRRDLDENGLPKWDLTGELPVRQHSKWVGKGFEYVTLANRESLIMAGRNGTIQHDADGNPVDWRTYDQHQVSGPWNYRKYAEGQEATTTLDAERLKGDVARFGWEAVEAIRQQTDPTFRLPDHMKGKPEPVAEPQTDDDRTADGKFRKKNTAA